MTATRSAEGVGTGNVLPRLAASGGLDVQTACGTLDQRKRGTSVET